MASNVSDLDKLPFIPEYELEDEEGPDSTLRFENCQKNPGHPNFTPVKQFEMEHLPEAHRTEEVMDLIKYACDRTVRIVVKYVSLNRPYNYPNGNIRGSQRITLLGTGFLRWEVKRVENKRCPCVDCKRSGDNNPKMEYLLGIVVTAKHVVFDTSEAKHSKVEFYYDSEDRHEVITFSGVWARDIGIIERLRALDMSYLYCVNHDTELYKKFDKSITFPDQRLNRLPLPFIVSHPHGHFKHITIGTELHDVRKVVFPNPQTTDPPFTFRVDPGRKCRLFKSHWATSLELFQRLVDCEIPCKPGVWYRVREGIMMSSNPSNCWICPYDDSDTLYRGSSKKWFVKFPASVEFIQGNHNENPSKSFPDVEFDLSDDEFNSLDKWSQEYHLEYDIDTCQGSSGAVVWSAKIRTFLFFFAHSGWDGNARKNRTGRRKISNTTL